MATAAFSLKGYQDRLAQVDPTPIVGRVVRTVGLLVESQGPPASIGEICEVRTGRGQPLPVEVVGFRDGRLLSVPLSETAWRLAMRENAQFGEALHQGVIMFARPLENELN